MAMSTKVKMTTIMLVVLILIVSRNGDGLEVPVSPCPNIFHYETSNVNQVQGVMTFKNDLSGYYKAEVNMTLAAFTNQNIAIKMVTPPETVQKGGDLTYHVIFPPSNTIPQVASLTFNDVVHCSALPGQGMGNFGYTTLTGVSYFATPVNGREPYSKPYTQPMLPVTSIQTTFQTAKPVSSSTPMPAVITPEPSSTPRIEPKTTTEGQPEIRVTPNSEVLQQLVTSDDHWKSEITVTSETKINISSIIYNRHADRIECGVAEDTQALLVHGLPTTEGQYPWLVAMFHLQESGDYKFKCAGNLVSNKHVITAAHCVRLEKVYSVSKENIILVLGKHNIRTWAVRSEIRDVREIYIHPQYRKPSDADIAVMVLYKDVEFTPYIKPICLWSEEGKVDKVLGHEGTVVGWGKDEFDNAYVPEPRQLTMPVVTQEECLRSDDRFLKLTSNRTFCAGGRNGAGPCTGDSGGGFFMRDKNRWMLRGIVSAALVDLATHSCDVNNFMVFADVPKYMPWINRIMSK